MKYIITESKLDKVVDSFITSQLGGLEQKLEKVGAQYKIPAASAGGL
jgi:hypothetical protein